MSSNGRGEFFADAARRYSELGMALVRLTGKVPRSKGWQNERPSPPEFAAGKWSRWGERFDMGVNLGGSQPPLAVVEPDTPEAQAVLLDLLGGEFPLAPTVKSGGRSLHLYFLDGGQGNASVDGLELRAGEMQCVVPPSRHPNTRRPYQWLIGREPWTVPLTPIPEPLLAYFAGTLFAGTGAPAAPVAEEIRQPERHKALLSLAGSMRRRGLTAEEITVALEAVNTSRCKPPLPDREVVELAADIARRYNPAPPDREQERIEQEAQRLLGRDRLQDEPRSEWETKRTRAAPALIVTLADYLAGNEDEADWVVDHLIGRGALTICAGLPKVGKSTLVFGMLGVITTSEGRPR